MKIKIILCYILLLTVFSGKYSQFQKPNIIIFLTDDQGWGDLSIHGNTNISTTNIDNLAKNGVSFNRFYVSPVCSPTRAELLTGKYFVRSGVNGVTRGYERMNLDHKLISSYFKEKVMRQDFLVNGTMDHSHHIILTTEDLKSFMDLHQVTGETILIQLLKKMVNLL